MNKNNLTRRDFLIKSASLMTVVYIIPDLVSKTEAKPLDEKVSSKTKWAHFVLEETFSSSGFASVLLTRSGMMYTTVIRDADLIRKSLLVKLFLFMII